MKRKIYKKQLQSILVLFLLAIGFTSLHAQGTYTVGASGNFPTLSAAVSSATVTAGSTLELLEGQTCANIIISKNLIIKKSPSATGDITLNYSGTVRHFTISANTSVTFENLIFQGPNATLSTTITGGGISSTAANSSLTLTNCKLTGCRGATGGAVSFTVATQTVTLNNTEISNCSSTNTGGGIHCAGTLTINNSTVSNNASTTTGGGVNATGALNITNNSTISNNTATTTGGGVNCTGASTITNSIISNNIAKQHGGGVYATGALTLNNVTVSTNKAGWTGTAYNTTAYSGGGVYANSNLTLQGAVDISNNGASGLGGGIYKNTATAPFEVSGLTSLKVNNNVARGTTGGGIYTATNLDFTTATNLSSAEINNNESATSGGGIYANVLLGLKNISVSGNKAGYNGTAYATGNYIGGGIYANGSLILAGSVTINGNTAGNTGGGIYKSNTASTFITATDLTSFTVDSNEAKGMHTAAIGLGGGIYLASAVPMDFSNAVTNISNNKAKVSGGGIYTTGTLVLQNATIAGNTAETGIGGGIYTNNTILAYNVKITNNSAGQQGGGIYITAQGFKSYNSTVSNNKAGQQGGGVYAYTATASQNNYITCFNFTLSDNKAGWDFASGTYSSTAYDGGGIFANGPVAFNDSLTITNNTATGNGGGICKNAGFVGLDVAEVKNLTLTGNQSIQGNGGGINSAFEMLFTKQEEGVETRAIISGNTAGGSGGAIYTTKDLYVTFTNDWSSTTISNNNAGQTGGAIFVNGGLFTLGKATVSGNKATGSGGAVYMANNKAMTILKSTFDNNNSGSLGGAIYSVSSNTSQEIANCTFFKDTATTDGGAIAFGAGAAAVYYCTFNGNNSTNGSSNAIYWNSTGTLNLNGNILYGNGTGNDSEVAMARGSLTASYNIVREQTIAGASNQTVPANQGATIFAAVDAGNPDLAILADNGGKTETILIKKEEDGGLAAGAIPLPVGASFGGNGSTDQRDVNRLIANAIDIGSVQITEAASCTRTNLDPIVWYVDKNASPSGSGMDDITHPAIDLATVLNNSCLMVGDTIKITSETYFLTDTDKNSSFILKKGVYILGGYTSDFSEVGRDFKNHPTILDGNKKSYHVVSLFTGADEPSQIDGVVIRNGRALGTSTSQTYGAGIYLYTGKLLLSNSVIEDNISLERGGGIYVAPTGAALTVRNTSFTDNKAGCNGTAIVAITGTSAPSAAELMKSSGGAICAEGNLELQGSISFDKNESGGNGGSIMKGVQNDFVATLLDTLIIMNSTAYVVDADGNWGGGGINTMINLDLSAAKKVKIHNSIAQSGQGGGIYTNNKTIGRLILRVHNGDFYNCRAQGTIGDGGAIESYGSTSSLVILKNCIFDTCYCTRYGGALGIGNVLKLEGSIKINNCRAGTNGAGITHWAGPRGFPEFDEFDVQLCDSLIITNCKTSLTSGTVGGGGIWISRSDLDLSPVKYVRIEGNTSTVDGGGIKFAAANKLTLGNAIIKGNKSGTINDGATFSAYKGGGIYTTGVIEVKAGAKIIVDGNMAGSDGGGIYCTSAFTANQADYLVFSNNEAGKGTSGNGGGLYSTGACDIINATITKNKAKTNGGGIYSSTTLIAQKCTFDQNTATQGGGIYATNKSTRTISNTTFSGNTTTAANGGGAIYSVTAGDAIRITLSTFNSNTTSNNQATAFYFTDAIGKVLNGNIIYGNGYGTEINLTSGILGEYNIIKGATSPFSGVGNMLVDANRIQEIFTNFLPGDIAVLNNNGGPTQTLNILRNGLAYNFIPKSLSWLSGINSDQTGSPRIVGCNVDAGAVELQGADPATSTWTSAGNADDWNDPANWENRDSNGNLMTDPVLPSACTNVIIPENATTYPILQKAGTIISSDKAYAQAACDTVSFRFGGEVAKTNYLRYNFAKADVTLEKSRWYLLSPVLQQQYSGDYLEDGSQYRINPEISIMYYQTGNPETGDAKVSSKFTGLFNNTDELLKIATGHALWVDEGNRPETQFTIHFPKDSIRYNYYDTNDNHITRISGIMQRDKRGRFIYEGNATYQSNNNGSFSQTVENSNNYPQVIIGNPYLSHFDIIEFQKQNSAYLSKSFRIWKGGTSYETYHINDDGTITGTDNDYQVSPFQSFIIDTELRFTNPLLFNPDMSITQPGSTLRSTSSDLASDVLRIEVLREGVRQSGMAVRYKMGESRHYNKNKDVWTVMPQSVGSYVALYSLVDGGAVSIYTTEDIITPIDLGISTGTTIKKSITSGKTETFTIQIGGDEKRLTGRDIYLYDAKFNITHNLTKSPYQFENTTGDVVNRFQLFADEIVSSVGERTINNDIRITRISDMLKIESSEGNPIYEITLYNTLGEQLCRVANLNTFEETLNIPQRNQVVVIKAQTAKGIKIIKMNL